MLMSLERERRLDRERPVRRGPKDFIRHPMGGVYPACEATPHPSMQAISSTFVFAAPPLRVGQVKLFALAVSQSEQQQQQQRLLLPYSCRSLPLQHALAVESSLQHPSSSSILIQGPPDFAIVSLGLVVLFWIGNYIVPDFIFKKLFGPGTGDKNDSEKQKVLDGLVGGIDKTSSHVASGPGQLASFEEGDKVGGAGFGKPVSKFRKENK